MKILSKQILSAASITPSRNSQAIDTSQMIQISAQVVTTAGSSPTFSVKLQASNDVCDHGNLPGGSFTPTNWTDISGATVNVTQDGAVIIPKTEICYRWVRVVITFTSGTGNVAVTIFGICL